jgi:hypothetical protein
VRNSAPHPKTANRARRAETRSLEKPSKVEKLYRSNLDPQHWFVQIPGTGWVRFPAKIDGWADHRLVTVPSHRQLNRVPLWLAFRTGLLEAIENRRLDRAA